jgi:hypothetical protein
MSWKDFYRNSLRPAFAKLNNAGIYTLPNFEEGTTFVCCSTCSSGACRRATDDTKPYIYFHAQNICEDAFSALLYSKGTSEEDSDDDYEPEFHGTHEEWEQMNFSGGLFGVGAIKMPGLYLGHWFEDWVEGPESSVLMGPTARLVKQILSEYMRVEWDNNPSSKILVQPLTYKEWESKGWNI